MKAVVTVTGKDTKGIIAKVSTLCNEFGANILARNSLIELQRAADRAVPAFGGGNAEAALCSHDDGIAG